MEEIKKLVICFLFLAVITQVQAQNDYKKYTYYTQLAHYCNSNDTALYYYEKAFRSVNHPFASDMRRSAVLYALKDKRNKMYHLAKELRKNGYSSDDMFNSRGEDSMFSKYKNEKRWQNIFRSPTQLTDIEFVSLFSGYLAEDQFVRTYNSSLSSFLTNSEIVDSLNNVRLKEYIETNGFPREEKVGWYVYLANTLLIHIVSTRSTKDDWYAYYKPLMLQEAEKGNVSYAFIATLDDRHNMIWNETQSYGTFLILGDNFEQPRLIDPANLDKRRAELGLPPFYLQVKDMNISMPVGYEPNSFYKL